jgi:hypothetical protein
VYTIANWVATSIPVISTDPSKQFKRKLSPTKKKMQAQQIISLPAK